MPNACPALAELIHYPGDDGTQQRPPTL
jgi:hypothetical protein